MTTTIRGNTKARLLAVFVLALGLALIYGLITAIQVQGWTAANPNHPIKPIDEQYPQPGPNSSNSGQSTILPTLTFTLNLPLVLKPPSAFVCDNVAISFSPGKTTYKAGDVVDITAKGIKPADGAARLYWARTSANTQLDSAWTPLDVEWNPSQALYKATWVVTDALPGPSPYNQSKNQEFIVAFTLWNEAGGKFVCSGNPDPGVVPGHPELPNAMCANCNKVLVTRDEPPGSTTSLADFWNIEPGYSFTYLGDRLDTTEDDNGVPITVTFETRLEYEAPVRFCSNISLIPQRWTKSSRWGYWAPCAAKPQDRNGNVWTEGNINVRFFLSDPRYIYPWEDTLRGAYAHKVYQVMTGSYRLGYLSDILDRTIIHTSHNHENYYYPPYMLSYAAVPNSGQDKFFRIDSIYHYPTTDLPNDICRTQTPTENHVWYARASFLTDNSLKNEFGRMQSYLTDTKDIVVLTFFEGGDYSDSRPVMREDWYLMKGVGLVGVDQATWKKDDTYTATIYLNAPFMLENTLAKPHVRIRADRGYTGDALEITPIAPTTPGTSQASFPLTVTAGNCYTVAVHSTTPVPMPYDGRMESKYDGNNPPTLWRKAIGGEPHWANNGVVVECLPNNSTPGEYKVRLRPYVTKSPSANETTLNYNEMPWSTNYLWIIVP
jgi:hypothetical protein